MKSVVAVGLLLACTLFALRDEVPDVAEPTKGNNQFALELYAKLRDREGNLFFSPFSISTALSMTSAGARDRTLDQMTATLHLPEQARLHPALGKLLRQLNEPSRKGCQLSIANALWGQSGYPFQKDFLTLIRDHYAAGFQQADFARDPEAARKAINGWVEEQTAEHVKDLLKEGVLTPDTRLVLTNAIYFKGTWASPFKPERTDEGASFTLASKKKVPCPLMSQSRGFNYLETAELQALELPYLNGDLSMVVLLPRKVDGLPDLERNLTTDNLADWLKKMTRDRIHVTLPRFQVSGDYDLKQPLIDLGMPLPFSREEANFSQLNGGKEPLYLSAVVHKAVIDVNEKGTEASGSTGVVIDARSSTPEFRADHPFLFLLRDNRSGSILFLGRLVSPKSL